MTDLPIDDTDRQILYLLQRNARITVTDVANACGVSGNTVRNRIERLEDSGIIRGYRAHLDYRQMDLDLHFLFDCTARVSKRERFAGEVLDIPGVTEVRELMTGKSNIRVEGVGADTEDITRVAQRIDEHGLTIEREALVRNDCSQPLSILEPATTERDG